MTKTNEANGDGWRNHPSPSTGRDLLRFLGTWVGDDLEDRLLDVYETRGDALDLMELQTDDEDSER